MSYPHIIRLRGPWQCHAQAGEAVAARTAMSGHSSSEAAAPVRAEAPADWGAVLGADFRGRVRYVRRFGRPAGLEAQEHVWLVVDGVDPRGDLSLNGVVLGSSPGYAIPFRHDVTTMLETRNTVEIEIEYSAEAAKAGVYLRPGREDLPAGPIGAVRLEIAGQCLLDSLGLEVRGEGSGAMLHVQGAVLGDSTNGPVELVVRGPHGELLYEKVTLGQDFQLSAPADQLPRWTPGIGRQELTPLSITLIAGATAVWRVERCVARRAVSWDSGSRVLRVDETTLPLPAPRLAAVRDVAGPAPSPCWPRELVVGCEQILPDWYYDAADVEGVALIQQVPASWSPIVCARLAHHPSIAAWSAADDDLKGMFGRFEAPWTFGRPWIARDQAIGESTCDAGESS